AAPAGGALARGVRRRTAAGGARHPRDVRRDREAPGAAGAVLDHEAQDLDRVVGRDELEQVERDPVRGVLETAVALAVADDVRPRLLADREDRRAPQLAAFLVADVQGLARRIAHGIVRPRRELVLAAVDRPGVAAAGLGDLEAEARVRHHVDPRCRRPLALTQHRDVLAAVRRAAAEAVDDLEIRTAWRGCGG